MHDESECQRDEVSRPPPYPWLYLAPRVRPTSTAEEDERKRQEGTKVRGNARRTWETKGRTTGCAHSPTWFLRMLKSAPASRPGHIMRKPLCIVWAFPGIVLFSYTGPDSCALAASTCPFLAFFFSSPVLFSFLFCPLFFPVSSPGRHPTTPSADTWIASFFFSFQFCALREWTTSRHTIFLFRRFVLRCSAFWIFIRSSMYVSIRDQHLWPSIANPQPIEGDNPKCHRRPWLLRGYPAG